MSIGAGVAPLLFVDGIISTFGTQVDWMNRRDFLISVGTIAAFGSIPFMRRLTPPKAMTIRNAYSLWYNRPATVDIPGGFCLGYVTSSGEVSVVGVTDRLLLGKKVRLHTFDDASDHGSPSLLKVPSGKHAGHILACFSNHATPLLCARTTRPESIESWEETRIIDLGRSTYVSLAAFADGQIILMHTLQERTGKYSTGEWRRVVARTTQDGGDTWSEPVQIAGFGPGTFPYSTPLAVAKDGRCAMSYAIYSAVEKRHQGLTVIVTGDAFQSKVEIPVDLGTEASADTVPYETKWLSERVIAVSYSQVSDAGKIALGRVALVDVTRRQLLSNTPVSEVAVHTYAGGVAIAADGLSVVYSPVAGGIVRQNLETGETVSLVEAGDFSSPSFITSQGQTLIVALKNPSIKTTRLFSAEVLVMPGT